MNEHEIARILEMYRDRISKAFLKGDDFYKRFMAFLEANNLHIVEKKDNGS